MKKFFAVMLAALTVWAVYGGYTNKDVEAQGTWGQGQIYFTSPKVVSDTTSLTTYKTILNVSGQGILYRLYFNNSSASYDPTVIINIDGHIDTLTEASSEDVNRFITRAHTENATGLDKLFEETGWDSVGFYSPDVNMWFKNNLSVKIKSENASGITQCTVLYGKR